VGVEDSDSSAISIHLNSEESSQERETNEKKSVVFDVIQFRNESDEL
jgi:hypothetical protein